MQNKILKDANDINQFFHKIEEKEISNVVDYLMGILHLNDLEKTVVVVCKSNSDCRHVCDKFIASAIKNDVPWYGFVELMEKILVPNNVFLTIKYLHNSKVIFVPYEKYESFHRFIGKEYYLIEKYL